MMKEKLEKICKKVEQIKQRDWNSRENIRKLEIQIRMIMNRHFPSYLLVICKNLRDKYSKKLPKLEEQNQFTDKENE